jgi:hypothetical protein
MTLYKYLSSERIDVLRNRRIRFTQAAALNDPFELNAYFEEVASAAQVREHLAENPVDMTPHLRTAYDELPASQRSQMDFATFQKLMTQVLASPQGKAIYEQTLGEGFEMMAAVTPDLRAKMAAEFSTKIGILSLTEAPDNQLMWAHYAEQHRGFVLGFNAGHEFFSRKRSESDEFFHLRKVEYRDRKVFASLMDMDGSDVLLTKARQWSYENESRMMIPVQFANAVLNVGGDLVYLFDLPVDAIESLIIGAHASSDLKLAVRELVSIPDFKHLSIHEARLDQRAAKVTFEPPLVSK